MPGQVERVGRRARVRWGGRVTARATTPRKAQAQLNLLRGVEHGWRPTGKPARKATRGAWRKKRQ